jgi:hypothetical protein
MNTKFRLESLKGRDHLENLDVNERIILKWILMKYGGRVWATFIRHRIGTKSRLL